MAILSREECKQILEKVLSFSKADECTVNINGSKAGNIRYARNTVSTSGEETNVSIAVQSSYGKRTGLSTVNELDDNSLEKAVRRSEELARLAPENPEHMEILGPQNYDESTAYFESTEKIDPEFRARAAENSIVPASKNGVVAAGFLDHSAGFSSMMNTKKLFAYHKQTDLNFTVTMRTEDGQGSGWAASDVNDASLFNAARPSQIAIEKAVKSKGARAIEPGRYTVILEPAAAVTLLQNMMNNFNARSADEGRSFLSKPGGNNKLNERIVDERVSIYTDPLDLNIPGSTWTSEGLPRKRTAWIENGVVKNLFYDRFWAQQKETQPVPFPSNFIMEGGSDSLEDMIKNTQRGVLVTRLWYIRAVDPQTLLYTGLTRDSTFYIENGELKFPVKNFRFNESPVIMLNNLEALGKPQRIEGNMVPPMKIRDFTFTSLSDAI